MINVAVLNFAAIGYDLLHMKWALPAAMLLLSSPIFALDGAIGIHDPSTAIRCDTAPTVAGTDRALAATEGSKRVVPPAFAGAPEQLWRIDELPDGTWCIMPKSIPNSKQPTALSAVSSSFATFESFDVRSDKQRWILKTP